MTIEMQKLTDRYNNEKNPEERKHLKDEMDKVSLSSGELEQVQQREVDRKTEGIRVFHEKRGH